MITTSPWTLVPQLKQARLEAIGQLLVQVRGEVIERHDPELGDTRLSLGVRAYECCRSRLIRTSNSGSWPWLTILTPDKRFTFAVDGIPVRFSRNDPEHLPNRKLVVSQETQYQYNLLGDDPVSSLRWFIVIDTHFDVPVEHAYVVGYREDNCIECQWEIPLSDLVPIISDLDSEESPQTDVPAQKAKLKPVDDDVDETKD